MAFHAIWGLIILVILVIFTLPFLGKGIKEKNVKKDDNLCRISWLGRDDGLFADTRSKLWAFVNGRQLFANAYFKVRLKLF
jgi:hypothetical protein